MNKKLFFNSSICLYITGRNSISAFHNSGLQFTAMISLLKVITVKCSVTVRAHILQHLNARLVLWWSSRFHPILVPAAIGPPIIARGAHDLKSLRRAALADIGLIDFKRSFFFSLVVVMICGFSRFLAAARRETAGAFVKIMLEKGEKSA